MRLVYNIGLFALCLLALLRPTVSQATHVRAGEITTRRLPGPSLTYLITLTAYYDESPKGRDAATAATEAPICFGDGTSLSVPRSGRVYINGNTSSVNSYTVIHTYAGPGTYVIGSYLINRNVGTLNLPPAASSDQLSFYVSTTILINAALQVNSTPVMLNPPLDSARVGQKFCHNPAAFDADGDSLAYRLYRPQATVSGCRSQIIPSYLDPTQFSNAKEDGSSPATFSIDPRTGDLCWDAPGQAGQFNFAFIIEEWRNGVKIGEIIRDMQLTVVDQPNKRPLIVGAEICVEAGTLIQQAITATDPDGQRVIIRGFGGPLNVNNDGLPLPPDLRIPPEFARLINGGVAQAQPATVTFNWQTNCNQARAEPYDITLKVNDVPGRGAVSLVSFATLRIRLYAPSVKNLTARPTATTAGRAIQLNWSAYSCGRVTTLGAGNDTTQLIIYRKEGCTPIQSQSCTTGLDPSYGYQEITRVPYTATSYIDTSALRRGVSYSYRIVARNPGIGNNGGFSVVSTEACLELPLLAPVMTQVTVDSTDTQRGQITVRWTRPLGLQPGDLGAPYQYRLQRATGLTGTDFVTVATINTNLQAGLADTVYVDKGSSTSALNTTANAYRYRVEFYYTAAGGGLTRLDVTEGASSVRLSAAPAQRQVTLSWQASVPWSNDNQVHDVYRSRSGPNGPFNKIDEVRVSGTASYTYVDTGTDNIVVDGNTSRVLSADSSYCYRVMTRGTYTDARLAVAVRTPLENYSQILCATPTDTTRPCPPRLGLDSLNCASLSPESLCNQTSFTNKLRWTPTSGPTCDPNVVGYKLYYGRYEQDTPAELVSIPAPTTSFEHSSLSTVAGCYYVTAVSRSGVESLPSNRVCNDACPLFVLPNVFTPNGDGKNDVFAALSCPRFVESVALVVYNRNGSKVYEGSSASLAWPGKSSDGTDLPSGLYYYQVSVRYAVLDRAAPAQVLKGWVQILREGVSMR
ncbi:gliding motility-associated C-terminal domain-containing protein [Spirosoma sp. RP8]|uniref:Gliding motility-associated C-terminal domain-containing protein n=1 Tax=Spirosoma liriopis TaxID=2937440 RepID=A0ABT0HR26_9BACT|nr:gliding motility-associated C-terminal domain-containing protein [Spirosoma liriopis]MCK8494272.1 gliding motility-associated C-terminal domain-containing protein [Spirosoma liriopis]